MKKTTKPTTSVDPTAIEELAAAARSGKAIHPRELKALVPKAGLADSAAQWAVARAQDEDRELAWLACEVLLAQNGAPLPPGLLERLNDAFNGAGTMLVGIGLRPRLTVVPSGQFTRAMLKRYSHLSDLCPTRRPLEQPDALRSLAQHVPESMKDLPLAREVRALDHLRMARSASPVASLAGVPHGKSVCAMAARWLSFRGTSREIVVQEVEARRCVAESVARPYALRQCVARKLSKETPPTSPYAASCWAAVIYSLWCDDSVTDLWLSHLSTTHLALLANAAFADKPTDAIAARLWAAMAGRELDHRALAALAEMQPALGDDFRKALTLLPQRQMGQDSELTDGASGLGAPGENALVRLLDEVVAARASHGEVRRFALEGEAARLEALAQSVRTAASSLTAAIGAQPSHLKAEVDDLLAALREETAGLRTASLRSDLPTSEGDDIWTVPPGPVGHPLELLRVLAYDPARSRQETLERRSQAAKALLHGALRNEAVLEDIRLAAATLPKEAVPVLVTAALRSGNATLLSTVMAILTGSPAGSTWAGALWLHLLDVAHSRGLYLNLPTELSALSLELLANARESLQVVGGHQEIANSQSRLSRPLSHVLRTISALLGPLRDLDNALRELGNA